MDIFSILLKERIYSTVFISYTKVSSRQQLSRPSHLLSSISLRNPLPFFSGGSPESCNRNEINYLLKPRPTQIFQYQLAIRNTILTTF